MANYGKDLENIEATISEKKVEKARLEERLASLEKERIELEAKISGHVPEGVDAREWLAAEEAEIKKALEDCSQILQGK